MNNGANNLALTTARSWHTRSDNGASSPNREDHRSRPVGVPWSPRLPPDEGGSMHAPWRLFEERVRTGPYGLSRFPSRPHSPVRILIFDTSGAAGAVDPRLRQFIQDSPPRIRGEWHLGFDPDPEVPGLTQEEFKMAMKKLRKHVHNPTYPRKKAWKRGLFGNRNNSSNQKSNNNADDHGEDESKECAICLEAFASNEQVMMTPCNHMFHNDCIVPWVKSRGQCPVCRFALCERTQRRGGTALALNSSSSNSNNYYNNTASEDLDNELFYLIRAMEEAFNWVNLSG